MGITRVEYDRLVRKRRKCRPGDPCKSRSEQSQGAPAPPQAQDPEPSKFMPMDAYVAEEKLSRYVREVRHLSKQLQDANEQQQNYLDEITAGSTSGLGSHINEGIALIDALNYHHDRVQQKQLVHKLKMPELKMLYDHYDAAHILAGTPHPPNHPLSNADRRNKFNLVESLVEAYGYEPLQLLQTYEDLTQPKEE